MIDVNVATAFMTRLSTCLTRNMGGGGWNISRRRRGGNGGWHGGKGGWIGGFARGVQNSVEHCIGCAIQTWIERMFVRFMGTNVQGQWCVNQWGQWCWQFSAPQQMISTMGVSPLQQPTFVNGNATPSPPVATQPVTRSRCNHNSCNRCRRIIWGCRARVPDRNQLAKGCGSRVEGM